MKTAYRVVVKRAPYLAGFCLATFHTKKSADEFAKKRMGVEVKKVSVADEAARELPE